MSLPTPSTNRADISAILGPTNTGKTHGAIERLLAHRSGIIGLPLRLLAREVYDKVAARRGAAAVALITGEEKIVPDSPRYLVCTVEAMPMDRSFDFLAVDEIQLCADPERGHVFTDRLLHARGSRETLFLGSTTMERLISQLVPNCLFHTRARFSRLSHTGRCRVDRLPPRSAVVAFSADEVYELADLLRRRRGGAAVVLGALSPRTRNAQVDLFQSGEVEILVATDAIGMGLNLDIDHVAFAGLEKFDGKERRSLSPAELAQVAGRAGRYRRDGTFGVTGRAQDIAGQDVQAVEGHRFDSVERLAWRSRDLCFDSPSALLASLDQPPHLSCLARMREGSDHRALQILATRSEVAKAAGTAAAVRLLWDACRIPDYSKISPGHHADAAAEVFAWLTSERGTISEDWMSQRLERVNQPRGDIAALADRLAHARTCQYIANQFTWHEDPVHWREQAREIEDRLSDALHEALMRRFLDRRAVALQRSPGKSRSYALAADRTVTVNGLPVARLEGLRLLPLNPGQVTLQEKAARRAAAQPIVAERVRKLATAPDNDFSLGESGDLLWKGEEVGKLRPGPRARAVLLQPMVDSDAAPQDAERVRRRLQAWLDSSLARVFADLVQLEGGTNMSAPARGIAVRLAEGLGILPRYEVIEEVRALDQNDRRPLRRLGVRFGHYYLFLPNLLKPEPVRWRLLLSGQSAGSIPPPSPGLNNLPANSKLPAAWWLAAGFHVCGARALRIDVLERMRDMIREVDGTQGFLTNRDLLSLTGCTADSLREILTSLGYEAERLDGANLELEGDAPSVIDRFRRPAKPKRDAKQHTNGEAKNANRKGKGKGAKQKTTEQGADAAAESRQSKFHQTSSRKSKSRRKASRQSPDPNSPFAALASLLQPTETNSSTEGKEPFPEHNGTEHPA